MKPDQLHELLTTPLTERIQRSHFALLNPTITDHKPWWRRSLQWLFD